MSVILAISLWLISMFKKGMWRWGGGIEFQLILIYTIEPYSKGGEGMVI